MAQSGTSTRPAPDAASTRRPTDGWPHVKISGGPTGRDVKIEVDGVEPQKVRRVEIVADARDAIHVTLEQLAFIEFNGRADVIDMIDLVLLWKGQIHRVQGYTNMPRAIRALADAVEESEQAGSTSGTVEDLESGRTEDPNGQDQEEPAPGEDGHAEVG